MALRPAKTYEDYVEQCLATDTIPVHEQVWKNYKEDKNKPLDVDTTEKDPQHLLTAVPNLGNRSFTARRDTKRIVASTLAGKTPEPEKIVNTDLQANASSEQIAQWRKEEDADFNKTLSETPIKQSSFAREEAEDKALAENNWKTETKYDDYENAHNLKQIEILRQGQINLIVEIEKVKQENGKLLHELSVKQSFYQPETIFDAIKKAEDPEAVMLDYIATQCGNQIGFGLFWKQGWYVQFFRGDGQNWGTMGVKQTKSEALLDAIKSNHMNFNIPIPSREEPKAKENPFQPMYDAAVKFGKTSGINIPLRKKEPVEEDNQTLREEQASKLAIYEVRLAEEQQIEQDFQNQEVQVLLKFRIAKLQKELGIFSTYKDTELEMFLLDLVGKKATGERKFTGGKQQDTKVSGTYYGLWKGRKETYHSILVDGNKEPIGVLRDSLTFEEE